MTKNIMFKSIDKFYYNFNFYSKEIIKFLKNNKFTYPIPIIKFLCSNKLLLSALILGLSYFFSNFICKVINFFLLFDSIILSLLIIQNKSLIINSRRLAKNILLLSMLYFKLIGSMLSFLLIIFIYSEYSKFINRLIFKIIKFFILIISNKLPFIIDLYPQINEMNFIDSDLTTSNIISDDFNKFKNNLKKKSFSSSSIEEKIIMKKKY